MEHPLEIFKFCPKCGAEKFEPVSDIAKKCNACGFEFYKNPTIGVVPLVFDDEGRLLVIRRAKNPGKGLLGFPGGFADIGETVEQALIREVKEESGLDITVQRYFCSLPNSYVYSGMDAYPLDFIFICKTMGKIDIKVQKSEVLEAMFVEVSKLDVEDFAFSSNKKAVEMLKNQ